MGFAGMPDAAKAKFAEASAAIEMDPGLNEGQKKACLEILVTAAGQVQKDAAKAEKLAAVASTAASFLKDPIGMATKFIGLG